MSSMAMPASSRSRTTWTRRWAPPLGRHGQPAGVLVDACSRPRSRAQSSSAARGDVGAVVDDDLDALAADLRLQLVGGAAGDDPAVVDDGDAVGQLVGLFQVLGGEQEGRALAHPVADDLPHAEPAARVEPGRRLVEEEQARPADQGAGEVEAAAHAAGVGLDDPVGGVGQGELLEQLVRAAPRGLASGSW